MADRRPKIIDSTESENEVIFDNAESKIPEAGQADQI